MKTKISLSLLVFASCLNHVFAQGSLTPPGAPDVTMKSLDQIEPRIPISSIPYNITQSGSYYLTSNLVMTAVDTNGITVSANNVTIDLNGFTLEGNSSARDGINFSGLYPVNLTVKNGRIINWTRANFHAIDASFGIGNHFENIDFTGNDNILVSGVGTYIARCKAHDNNAAGNQYVFDAGDNSIVTECQVFNNTAVTFANLIYLRNAAVVSKCTLSANAAGNLTCIGVSTASSISECNLITNRASSGSFYGIYAPYGNTAISSCGFYECYGASSCYSIYANAGSSIQQCALYGSYGVVTTNGVGIYAQTSKITDCSVAGSDYDGIEASYDCHVYGNVCQYNGAFSGLGAGIRCTGNGNRIEANNSNGNGIGIVAGSDNIVMGNTAHNNTASDYSLTGSAFGPIIDMTAGGDISGSTGNPWANFRY